MATRRLKSEGVRFRQARELCETARKLAFRVKCVSDIEFQRDLLSPDDRLVLKSQLVGVRTWAAQLLQELDAPAGNKAFEDQPTACKDTGLDANTRAGLKELLAGLPDLTECLHAESLLQERFDELLRGKGGMPRVGEVVKWCLFGRTRTGTVLRRSARLLVVADDETGGLFSVSPELLADVTPGEPADTATSEASA